MTRYLNLVESLAITLDHVETNELGSGLARVFNAIRVFTNGGTDILVEHRFTRSEYLTYLACYTYVTFLNLQMFRPQDIVAKVPMLLADTLQIPIRVTELAARMAISGVKFEFVRVTNPAWQDRYGERASAVMGLGNVLMIEDDAGDPVVQLQLARQVLGIFLM